jgi:hypothetical protein
MARPPRPPVPPPAEPRRDRSEQTKKLAVIACYITAVAGFAWAVALMVTGHANQGGPLLLFPIAALIVSTLIPKGWRG